MMQEPEIKRRTAKRKAELIKQIYRRSALTTAWSSPAGVTLEPFTTQVSVRPHIPQQNGMVERSIESVKEQRLWLHNFASL